MLSRIRLAAMVIVTGAFWVILGSWIGWIFKVTGLGFVLGLLFGVAYLLFSQWGPEKFVLETYEGELLESDVAPNLYEMVFELSQQAGIEPPIIYVLPLHAPNCFALGRADGAKVIGVTNGLTTDLEKDEVRGLMALMIARIASGEATVWSIAATLAGQPMQWARSAGVNDTLFDQLEIDPEAALTVPGKILLTLAIPPCAGALRLGFNTQAVLDMDDKAVEMTHNPKALASALRKIQRGLPTRGWGASGYNPATALLFAVPPLPPVDSLEAEKAFFVRVQRAFPFQSPDAIERGDRLIAKHPQGDAATLAAKKPEANTLSAAKAAAARAAEIKATGSIPKQTSTTDEQEAFDITGVSMSDVMKPTGKRPSNGNRPSGPRPPQK